MGYISYIPGWPFLLPVIVIGSRWKDLADTVAGRVTIKIPISASLLIIRSVGDEASAALAPYQLTTWCARKISKIYVSLFKGLGGIVAMAVFAVDDFPWVVYLVILFILMILGLVFYVLQLHILAKVAGILLLVLVALVATLWALAGFGPGLLIFAIGFAISPLIGMLLVSYLAFGFLALGAEMVMANLFYDVTPEPVPCGRWSVDQIVPTVESEEFRHSATYEDPAALARILEWILSKREDVTAVSTSSSQP